MIYIYITYNLEDLLTRIIKHLLSGDPPSRGQVVPARQIAMGKGVTWRDMVRSIATARIVTCHNDRGPGNGWFFLGQTESESQFSQKNLI